MSLRGLVRFAALTAASGESQNFLGAPWVSASLRVVPRSWKRPLALRLLSLSPHYFYRNQSNARLSTREFLESECLRNRDSRQSIIDDLLSPFLKPGSVCLDYGCGPGFLALAASPRVRRVFACDISPGVLACAREVNLGPNIEYRKVGADGRIPIANDSVDLVYSFAVIQHVTDEAFSGILREFHRVMKPGATAVCHVVVDGSGWKSESEWRADTSLKGRLKWKMGLHCFSRTPENIERTIAKAGFTLQQITPISMLVKTPSGDDIERQHLCVFAR